MKECFDCLGRVLNCFTFSEPFLTWFNNQKSTDAAEKNEVSFEVKLEAILANIRLFGGVPSVERWI